MTIGSRCLVILQLPPIKPNRIKFPPENTKDTKNNKYIGTEYKLSQNSNERGDHCDIALDEIRDKILCYNSSITLRLPPQKLQVDKSTIVGISQQERE